MSNLSLEAVESYPAQRRRLYLMRHASVSYFNDDGSPVDPRHVQLTERGRHQAHAAAQVLATAELNLAVCSGLTRTRETASIVLGDRSLILEEVAGFREIRSGRLRELAQERLEQELAYPYELATQPDSRFLGGETYLEFSQRVLVAWHDLLALDWRHALLVAHDAVNRILLGEAQPGDTLSGMSAFEQDPACINIIDLDIVEGKLKRMLLRTVNFTPYDPLKHLARLTVMERVHRQYKHA